MSHRVKNPQPDRRRLLDDLAEFATGGVAESTAQESDESFFRAHLPIPEHRRVLDRDTMLILGGRGTGKTQLFDALRRLDNPSLLAPGMGAASVCEAYVTGFTTTRTSDHPRSEVLQRCLTGDAEGTARNFWVGLLAGVLLQDEQVRTRLKAHLRGDVPQRLEDSLASPGRWLTLVDEHLDDVLNALDRVDEALKGEGRYLYVTYDDLDVLATKMTHVYPLVRELLALWLRNSRRWGNLRCKVFLRTDIFDADELAFTDSSKLRPRSVTLRWVPDNLYRLVLKRLLNGKLGDEWRKYLKDPLRSERIRTEHPWGIVPTTGEPEHKEVVKVLVGSYMGSDPRRGATYSWFLNHLRDSLKDIAPRSFLKLFEASAKRQLASGLPRSDHLLEPQHIAGALGDVSTDRISELTNEEYPWIRTIAKQLDRKTVPMERREFRKLLTQIEWSEGSKPLYVEPDRLIDYLLSLGILRATDDGRIHVPDIYLYGFGLRRKGGIRRPRA